MPDQAAAQQDGEADQRDNAQQQHHAGGCAHKAVAEADQHRHQHSAGHPGAVLGMLDGHGVSNRVDLQSSFPRQDSQADRRSCHGVDEQDHQHGVDQPQPVMAGERLQCLGICQKKTQP